MKYVYLVSFLLFSYDSCQQQQQQQYEDDEERESFEYHDEIDHLKEIEGVHWSTLSRIPSVEDSVVNNTSSLKNPLSNTTAHSKTASSRYDDGDDEDVILARRQKSGGGGAFQLENEKWEDGEYYLLDKGEEHKLVEKSLDDKDVRVWRDMQECKYAMNVFRVKAGLRLVAHRWNMSYIAEKWAVFLASNIENLIKNDRRMIYMSRNLEKMGYGMLVYYADNLLQGPGCNMAIVAFLHELNIATSDDIHQYSPAATTKAVAGDFRQLFWKRTEYYGTGISYNKKTHSGFVVMLFKNAFTNTSKLDDELPSKLDLTYWQLLLPGYRNSLHKAVSHESNLGYKPCYSRYEKCHEWAKLKHCEIPAFRDFMYYNCYLSCSSCILVIGVPIPGGWSSWSQISSCSTPRCGGGYKVYYRFCNMPPKRFGGKDCPGPRIRKTNCHMTKCDLPKDGCYDEELDCGKRKKYCDHKDYAPYMKFHCKKTCKTC